MALVQIKDKENLVRDTHSKAVLSTDKIALNSYLMQREIAKKQNEEKQETKLRLIKLEEDMNEIRNLLKEISMLRNSNGN